MIIESDNANSLYQKLISEVDNHPDFVVSPRGMKIIEKINMTAILTNPRNCLVTLKQRNLNYRFAAIEKLEYLWGKHDLNRIVAYNSQMKKYAGPYNYSDGNYAQRFNYWLDHIYGLLQKDPDSRQAVVSIYDSTARHQSGDIPCTLTLQFLIRNNRLNLIVNMRSNDLLWGLPYDINAFCFLQEVMASWLGIEMGKYYHNAGSMHIYTDPEENHAQLLATSINNETVEQENPKWDIGYEETKEWLPAFFHMEQRSRRLKSKESGWLPTPLMKYYDLITSKWTSQV